MFSMASHCPRNRKGALEASQDLAIAPSGASASKSPEKFAATLVAKMTIHWNSLELGVRHFQTNPEGPGRPQIISSFMFIRNPLSAPPQAGFLALSATTLLCPLFMYIYTYRIDDKHDNTHAPAQVYAWSQGGLAQRQQGITCMTGWD